MPDEPKKPKKPARANKAEEPKQANEQRSRKLRWDPDDPEQTRNARDEFNAARREGMTAYRYRERVVREAEEVKRFPAKAGEVLLTRQLVGG